MARSEELQVVVRAVDEASATLKKIHADLEKMGVNAQQTTTHIDALGNKLTSLGQRVKEGFGAGIGFAVFNEIDKGLHSLLDVYPQIIGMGSGYLEQLHQIQLETGMTAEQTSVLVGATRDLGVPTDALEVLFSRLGKNLSTNEKLFRDLGVATRDSSNAQLGAYQIVQNLREQVSKHGEALLTTGAAVQLFGRNAAALLPYLTLNQKAVDDLTASTERWGGVVSQDAIDGARQFNVAMNTLTQGITDTATNIFAALSPYLTAFVDAFAKFVQSHLQEIINFAVQVASTVMGVLGGLLGFSVDFSKATANVAAGTDKATTAATAWQKAQDAAKTAAAAFTAGIQSQIKAIDAHIAALTAAAQKRKAIEEEEKLRKSLADARSQLKDLQGNTPFLGGLSAAEQVLAMQKHAQDIADAKKAVGDAQESLGNFQLDQRDQAERQLLERQKARLSDELAAHRATNAAIANSGLQLAKGIDTGMGSAFKNIGIDTQKFAATAQASFKAGSDAAKGFIDLMLGSQQSLGPGGGTYRTGGVIGAIGRMIGALGGLGITIDGVVHAIHVLADALAHIPQYLQQLAPPTNTGPGGTFNIGDFLFKGLPGYDLTQGHAAGGVFDTLAPTRIGSGIMGEAAGETVAILSHPRAADIGASGSGQPLVIQLVLDGKKITEVVSRHLYYQLNHSPVTSNPAGSF